MAGRSVLNEQIDEVRPKVFIPIHHDPCAYDVYGQVVNQLDTIPASLRPRLDFISDPGDYLRPEVFNPSAKIWAQTSNPPGTGLEPTSTPVPNPGPSGASPLPKPTPAPTSTPSTSTTSTSSSTSTQVPVATAKTDGYMPSGTASEVGVAVATNTKSAKTIGATTTSLVVQIRKAMGSHMTVKVLGVPAAGQLKLALSARSGKRTVSVGSASRTLKRAAKSVTFRLRLSKAARKLVAAHSKTKATLKLNYKPVGASSQSVSRSVTISR